MPEPTENNGERHNWRRSGLQQAAGSVWKRCIPCFLPAIGEMIEPCSRQCWKNQLLQAGFHFFHKGIEITDGNCNDRSAACSHLPLHVGKIFLKKCPQNGLHLILTHPHLPPGTFQQCKQKRHPVLHQKANIQTSCNNRCRKCPYAQGKLR